MKKSLNITLATLLILTAIPSGCKHKEKTPSQSNPQAEKIAIEAAANWLELVDSEQYDQSCQQAATFFQNAVKKDNWQQSLQAFREPLGKIVSRKLIFTHYTTSAPGAPDGQYVIIQYDSSFENKKSAVETVTPMLDKDGKWKVSGYYIK
jgi:hypothetical protein